MWYGWAPSHHALPCGDCRPTARVGGSPGSDLWRTLAPHLGQLSWGPDTHAPTRLQRQGWDGRFTPPRKTCLEVVPLRLACRTRPWPGSSGCRTRVPALPAARPLASSHRCFSNRTGPFPPVPPMRRMPEGSPCALPSGWVQSAASGACGAAVWPCLPSLSAAGGDAHPPGPGDHGTCCSGLGAGQASSGSPDLHQAQVPTGEHSCCQPPSGTRTSDRELGFSGTGCVLLSTRGGADWGELPQAHFKGNVMWTSAWGKGLGTGDLGTARRQEGDAGIQ